MPELTDLTPEEQAHIDAVAGGNTSDNDSKELILGKFKTNEDLAKAYTELEKRLGQDKTKSQPATEKETSENINAEVEVSDATRLELGRKPDASEDNTPVPSLRELLQPTAASGEDVSDDIRATLKQHYNLSDADIDTLNQVGQKEYRDNVRDMVQMIGGEDKLAQLNEYVMATYDEDQIAHINKLITDPTSRKVVIKGLLAEMPDSNTTKSLSESATNTTGESSLGFRSPEEVTEAMSDPRYRDGSHPHHKQYVEWFNQHFAATPVELRY